MNKKKIKKFLVNNEYNLIISIVSLVALLIGNKVVGFGKAFLIILVIDMFIFVPSMFAKVKNIKRSGSKMKVSDYQDKANKSKSNSSSRLNKNNKSKKKRKWLKRIIFALIILFIVCVGAFAIFMIDIIKNAPKFDEKKLYAKEQSIVYDAKGDIIAKLGSQAREKVSYDDLPEVLVDAIIATEDSRFFEHNGFDLPRFLKAGFGQVLGRNAGGASTLTMQIVKNHFTSTTATGIEGIKRKFTDIYMSIFQVEKNYTKKEIMEFYVNAPYLGSGSWGVEQACQVYFGKSVGEINLAEAAMIAGLFQAPNSYDPNIHPDLTEKRRETVLYLMERHGYITKEEHKAASAMDVDKIVKSKDETSSSSTSTNKYQAFVDTVVEEVINDTGYDPYNVSMKIYATMDKEKQEHINAIMSGETFNWENEAVDAGVMVLNNQTGEIVAVGAGRNRKGARSFNNATMIKRQIGSTAKPLYDYGPGIEYENWSTYTPFVDEPHSYSNGTAIENWDRTYSGFMTMRQALAASRNIPALKAFQQNKNSNIKKFVTSLGLSPEVSEDGIVHEAHALGGYNGESPLTMAAAYGAFGNGGYYITPHSYTKIIYRETDKEVVKEVDKHRAMSEETAYMMTSLLQSSAQQGLGAQANIGGAIFGAKTGTSNYDAATIKAWNMKGDVVNDLWVNGTSPDYAISIWYGYSKINPNYHSTSYTISHRRLFQAVAKGVFKNGSNWTKPDGVSEVTVELGSNPAKLASETTPDNKKVTELFKKGTEPTETSKTYSSLDNVTSLRGSVSGNKATLTWTAASPLTDIDTSSYGDFGYEIYSRGANGDTLIGFTTATKYEFTVTSSSSSTYVVKTSYRNNSTNRSSGAEVKINLPAPEAKPKASLAGLENVSIGSNETYTDQGVNVTLDGKTITAQYSTTVTYTDSSGATTTSSMSTLEAPGRPTGTYVIIYTITNQGYTGGPLTRTVIVN